MVKDLTKLWEFKYAPKTFDEMVLHPEVRSKLEKVIEEKPNVILFGKQGVGKGTFYNIFKYQEKIETLKINASLHTGIDTIRNSVYSFAKSANFSDDLKYVFLDEAEGLSSESQKSMAGLIEEVNGVTRFMCASNKINRYEKKFKDRFVIVEFTPPPKKDILKHLLGILKKENIKIEDSKVLADIVKDGYPSIRQCVKLLQGSCRNGVLKEFRPDTNSDINSKIYKAVKNQDLEEIRSIFRNYNVDTVEVYKYLFENVGEFASPGDMIIEIGDALYKDKDHAIPEINFIYFVTKSLKSGLV